MTLSIFFRAGLLTLLSLIFSASNSAELTDAEKKFVKQTIKKHQLPENYIINALNNANKNQDVLDAISKPWEAKPWYQYHPIFLTEKRVLKGAEFWQKHQATLEKAEQQYGVPAQIIVSILAVESFFGQYKGKYPVLDSLYTLGFHYPRRSKFFLSELGHFLHLSYQQQFELTTVLGSYAGAMGWSQFISSSYRHYAVDFDNDGKKDLINSPADAIGSVANYFKQHKWQKNELVVVKAKVNTQPKQSLFTKSLKPKTPLKALLSSGIEAEAELNLQQKVKLLSFELETGQEYWLGLHNFYVITRYNHSPLYAMAVYQLSEQIKQAYKDSL